MRDINSILGNKARNGMVSKSVCALAKGDEKVKIIQRGFDTMLKVRARRPRIAYGKESI